MEMPGQVRVLGLNVDAVSHRDAMRRIIQLTNQAAPAVAVTANLDHAVRLRRNPSLRHIYDRANLALADGFPLIMASRLRGPHLPERVTGADLIDPLCSEASRLGKSVFILGTTLPILSKACRKLKRQHPDLEIAGAYAPSVGFGPEHPQSREVADLIIDAQPSIVFVALGSPKQEIWAHAHAAKLPAAVFVCVGAGFDYLAGQPPRAPLIVRKLCMEWFWRLAHDPRRLGRRYALDLIYLPILLAEHMGLRLRSPSRTPEREYAADGASRWSKPG